MIKRRKKGIEGERKGEREGRGGKEGKWAGQGQDEPIKETHPSTNQPPPSTVYTIMNSSMCECIYYVFIIMIQ